MNQQLKKTLTLLIILTLTISTLILFSSQIAKADDTNLVPLPEGWDLTYGTGPYIYFLDTSVLYNSESTIRSEPHTSADTNYGREINVNHMISVSPGDNVVFIAYVKTGSHANAYSSGARLGIDFYGPSGILDTQPHAYKYDSDGSHTGTAGVYYSDGDGHWVDGAWDYVNYQTFEDTACSEFLLPWGNSAWTMLMWNVTVPSQSYTQTLPWGTSCSSQQIYGIIPWMDCREVADEANAWFAATEVYVNPDEAGGGGGDGGEVPSGTEILQISQNLTTGSDYTTIVEGSGFHKEAGQTFTTGANNISLTKISANLTTIGTDKDIIYEVYATSGGKPTGTALSSGTITAGSFTDKTFANATMSTYILTANTQYALVGRSPTADGSNFLEWYYHSSNPYSGGTWLNSTDSGVTWTTDATKDFAFRIYGETMITDPSPSPTPTPSPVVSPTPTPSPNPSAIIYGEDSTTYYLRSDTFTVNNITGYGLDPVNTNSAATITDTITTQNVSYGFRIYTINSASVATELTSGTPEIQLTRTANGEGWQNTTWTCPATTLTLGEDAIEAKLYISLDNGATWTNKATYTTNTLLFTEILPQTWTFNAYTTRNTTTGAATITFGSYTYNSRIDGIGFTSATNTEELSFLFLSGNYILFLITAYTQQVGAAAYLLILMIPTVTLYLRHRNFGPVLILFALFGGPGGLIWLFVPPWAAVAADILLVLGASFIVWKLIR